jgi:hypothetical protein
MSQATTSGLGPSASNLTDSIRERLASTRRPETVRLLMEEFLIGLIEGDEEVKLGPGHQGWNAIEARKRGRLVARVFPKNGLIQVDNYVPGSKDGDYGDELKLGDKGVWRCALPSSGEMPDALLRCVADAIAHVGGRRVGFVRPGTPEQRSQQRREWARSRIRSSTRFAVLVRDDYTCQYCGRSAPEVVLHVDHRTPTALGGGDELNNLVTACLDCNLGKGARHTT